MTKDNGLIDPKLGQRILAEAKLRRMEMRIELAIKAVLAKQKAKAIAALRTQRLTAAAPPDAFALDSWDSLITDDVLPVVGDVLGDMTTKVFNFLQLPPEARSKILGQIDVNARTNSFVQQVTSIGPDIAQRVTDELTIGVAKGEGIDDLTSRLNAVFDIGDNIAERIARTETHGAAESTTHDSALAINAAGFDVTKQWLATSDGRTRESHSEADGQTVNVNDSFEVDGEELAYPGDPDGSAGNVINCRCSVIYDQQSTTDPDMPDQTDDGSGISDDSEFE